MRLPYTASQTRVFNRQVLGKLSNLAFLAFFALYAAGAMLWLFFGLSPALAAASPSLRDTLSRLGGSAEAPPALAELASRIAYASQGAQTGPLYDFGYQPGFLLVVLEYLFSAINLTLGILLVRLRPHDWPARLLALGMVGTAAVFNIHAHGAYDVIPALVEYTHDNFHFVAGVAYVCGLLLFPDGKLPHWPVPVWVKWPLRAVYLVVLGYMSLAVTVFFHGEDPLQFILFFGVFIPIAGLTSQAFRYRRASTPEERQQSRVLMWALALAFGASLLVGVFALAIRVFEAGISPATFNNLMETLLFLVFPLLFTAIPFTLAAVLVRYHLWDMDRVINRTIVFAILTGGVVCLYVLLVGAANLLVFGTQGNWLVSLLTVGIIAVLFQPLRERLQRGVNRLMYGERDDPYAVLSRLGQRLEGTLAPDAVLSTIVETIAQSLKLPYVAIVLKQDDEFVVAAASGSTVRGDLCRLPLVYQGETEGELHLAPRRPGESFTPADRRLLGDLARQAEVAVHAVRLTSDLRRARERLVTAREEERRRLRRDLHDGLGPQLASHTLALDAACRLLERDPQAAAALLRDLKSQSQSSIAGIRRLVYNLRPPALDDLGLVPALRELAEQYAHTGVHTTVEAPETLPPLPAAVEVACYRIVQEALTNVVRHASARNCNVCLEVGEALCVEISDDGLGLPAEPRTGVGLRSMRERAEELGGRCVVETSDEGGTRVRALLPLPKEEP